LPRPVPGSFFAEAGWLVSNLVPLALVALGLVGHALRERSPGYAFAAGLVADAAVMGGYALGVVIAGRPFGEGEWARLVQLGTITAAVWALLWLASRRWVGAWREGPEAPLARPLMLAQLALAAAGNACLLGVALGWLALVFPAQIPNTAGAFYFPAHAW